MARGLFSLDILGDKSSWIADGLNSTDTGGFSLKLKHLVREVINTELTPLQQQTIKDFYYGGKSVTQIAAERGVNKSSVSRVLKTAQNKIGLALKYGAFHIWQE